MVHGIEVIYHRREHDFFQEKPRQRAIAKLTAGFACAPDTPPVT
jgi:hypothetical protein